NVAVHYDAKSDKSNSQAPPKFYFAMLPEQVVSSGILAKLSGKAAKVYIAALSHARDGNKPVAWPSNQTLAKEAGVSPKRIPEARREIEQAGLVTRRRVDRKICYSFIATGFEPAPRTDRSTATPRPRDHCGRFAAFSASQGKSGTSEHQSPQFEDSASPQ